MDVYAIIDDEGVIFDGTEDDMKDMWEEIKAGREIIDGIVGRLKLVKIIYSF